MGFFDRTNQITEQPSNEAGPQTSLPNAETFVGIMLMLVVPLVVIAISIIGIRRYNQSQKSIAQILEKKRSWRATKILYWVAIVFIAGLLFMPHEYASQNTAGFGFVVILASYPGLLVVRRTFVYITGLDQPNDRSKHKN